MSTLIRIFLAFLLLCSTVCAQEQVSRYSRTQFGQFTAVASNPFMDIKVAATFKHISSGSQYKVPVVCTASSGGGFDFQVVFTPFILGYWEWWIDASDVALGNGASVDLDPMPTSDSPEAFTCISSSLIGWTRPDILVLGLEAQPSGTYRHTLVKPHGNGTFSYVRPAQTTFFNLANQGWSSGQVSSTLSWPAPNGIHRIRFALTSVDNRSAANNPGTGAANHTVFVKTGSNFLPQNIDFTRFDLSQWSTIDSLAADIYNRSLSAAIILSYNSGESDYEESFFDGRGGGSSFSPISTPSGSVFTYMHQFYIWYVVGRLAAYTNIHWCTMHEWNNQTGSGDSGPYPVDTARQIGITLKDYDPYLKYDLNLKIVNSTPARGSAYAGSSNFNRLSTNLSPFLTSTDDSWRSCIGLHRGGEIGITSIVEQFSGAGGTESINYGYPCTTTSAHRVALQSNGTDRPILIEEDWVSRNDPVDENDTGNQPYVAFSFARADNPYAKYIGPIGSVGSVVNSNVYSFIPNNYNGLRKVIRDSAWMAGVVCQTHTSYWTRRNGDLSESINSTSVAPYKAIDKAWNSKKQWWRFTYSHDIVTGQSVLAQLAGGSGATFGTWSVPNSCLPGRLQNFSGTGRPPYEQLAIGAKSDHGGSNTQYVIYCPVGGTVSDVTANLSDIGVNTGFTYYFVNPDDATESMPVSTSTPISSTLYTFPTPASTYQGEHGEYVIIVN